MGGRDGDRLIQAEHELRGGFAGDPGLGDAGLQSDELPTWVEEDLVDAVSVQYFDEGLGVAVCCHVGLLPSSQLQRRPGKNNARVTHATKSGS